VEGRCVKEADGGPLYGVSVCAGLKRKLTAMVVNFSSTSRTGWGHVECVKLCCEFIIIVIDKNEFSCIVPMCSYYGKATTCTVTL